ncbi:MAG: twin-arginine translocase TatA/TatE family subunit, partial [Anaerolineales bacterium]
MEILGIGPMELLLVLLLALALIGPRDLGKHARGLGRALRRLYRSEEWAAVQQASRNLRSLPNRLAREADLEELDAARRGPPATPAPADDENFAWRRPSRDG